MANHLKASPPERYEEISRLLQQAQEELDKGDILQASDKVWGAVTDAVKAHARQRGWNCHTENYVRDAARCIAVEQGREDLRTLYGYLEAVRRRLEEQFEESDEALHWLSSAVVYVREMAALQPPKRSSGQPGIPAEYREDQERRLGRLMREPYAAPISQYGTDNLAPEECETICRHQLQQAQESLDLMDLERADVESWNAAAYAIKALCQQRGWNHHDRRCLRSAVGYVAIEFNRKDLITMYGYLENESVNYFEHPLEVIHIRRRIEETAKFIHEFGVLRTVAPPAGRSHLSDKDLESQEKRLMRLTQNPSNPSPQQ